MTMPIQIRAYAVVAPGRVQAMPIDTPDLRMGEALISVRAVALCTLEQRVFSGRIKPPLPFLGGHEVSGVIEALSEGTDRKLWAEGRRVAVRLLYNCGECYYCRSGRTNLCVLAQKKPVREGLLPGPGGLCDRIIVHTSALYAMEDSLSFTEAALTEPLACCVHSVERADIQLAEDVVVVGGGIMGQFHALLSKLRGARVILSEVSEARGKMARERGADVVFNPQERDPVSYIRSLTDGRGADVVFNTTAIPEVFDQSCEMVGKGGRVIQYSSIHPDLPSEIRPQRIHNSEIILTGSISPSVRDFSTANRLLNAGLVDCGGMVSASFPFESVQEAFEAAVSTENMRVLVTS